MRLPGLRRPGNEADVVVVGSGLPSLTAALELARRGARVALATDAAAPEPPRLGLLLLGSGRPYASVAREISRAAAQLVWAAGCENHLRAKAFLDAARQPCGFVARGSFLLARDRREAEEIEQSEDMLRDDGFPGEFLDHYMLETRFDVSGFQAAYWCAGDAELEPAPLHAALAAAAREAGVSFAPGHARAIRAEATDVRVETSAGPLRAAAAVVATAGPAAGLVPELASLLERVPLSHATFPALEGASLPSVARTADARIAWQARGTAFVLAETARREAGADGALRELAARLPLSVSPMHRGPSAPAPAILDEEIELSKDGLPLVGPLPGRPLAVACGFGRLPHGLAFAAARWVADALLVGRDPTPESLAATRSPRKTSALRLPANPE